MVIFVSTERYERNVDEASHFTMFGHMQAFR